MTFEIKIRKVYGRDNLKVVRAFNEWKGRVEYDVLFFDDVFTGRWHSMPRRPEERVMSRKMADWLYNQALKPIMFIPCYDDEE